MKWEVKHLLGTTHYLMHRGKVMGSVYEEYNGEGIRASIDAEFMICDPITFTSVEVAKIKVESELRKRHTEILESL